MHNLLTIVGERIKIARKNRELTQTQLGEMVNLPQSYIGSIERGEKNISLETLERLVNALKINPGELFEPLFSDEDVKRAKLSDELKLIINKRNTKDIEIIHTLILDVFSAIDNLKK